MITLEFSVNGRMLYSVEVPFKMVLAAIHRVKRRYEILEVERTECALFMSLRELTAAELVFGMKETVNA